MLQKLGACSDADGCKQVNLVDLLTKIDEQRPTLLLKLNLICHPIHKLRLLRMSWTERKTNKWVLEKIGSVLMLRKSMSEIKMRLFGHIVRKNGMEKRLMPGEMEGKRRRGRPATTWTQDLKE